MPAFFVPFQVETLDQRSLKRATVATRDRTTKPPHLRTPWDGIVRPPQTVEKAIFS